MVSKRFDYLENPQSLFHPIVRNEEEVYSLKHFYTPKPTIQPSNEYSKSKLSEIVDHQWMKDMDFRLVCKNTPENSYGAEIEMVSNPLQWFKSIEKECTTFNIDKKDLKLVAFDLETTGLNVNVSFIGGQIQRYENLVGLCLAIKGDQGFYLPISHTEQDGVVNWTTEEIKELIDYLTNDEVFHLIVHNAQYDLTILRTYGWKIPKICSDTMIIHKLMNNYEFYPFNIKNGLKQLSEFLLKRKMIEINSFFGEKEMIEFNRLPATMAYSYGCSDAVNTIELFKYFIIDDKEGRSPYHNQYLNYIITHKYIYHIVSQATYGLTIDFEHAMGITKTTIRRIILLERKWNSIMEANGSDKKISSNEQANQFIGDLLKKNFFGDPTTFDQWAGQTFGIVVKYQKVGKGDQERTKITYNMDDTVISAIKSKLKSTQYKEEIINTVLDVLDIVTLYRSYAHDIPMYIGLIRSSYRDDRGITIGNIGVRMEGTDCLVAGTPINIKFNGKKISMPIENLSSLCYTECNIENEGEYILFPNVEIECGINEYVEITHFVVKNKKTLKLKVENTDEFGCAIGHRMISENGEWVRADSLKIGDRLKSVEGYRSVLKISETGEMLTYDVVTNHKNFRPI